MKKEADRREGKEMGVEVSSRARRSIRAPLLVSVSAGPRSFLLFLVALP